MLHIHTEGKAMTFKEYLDSIGESQRHFAKRVFLADNTVYRLYKGEPVKVKIANKVVRACKGHVQLNEIPIQTYYAKIYIQTIKNYQQT